jgi:hypothetical protein
MNPIDLILAALATGALTSIQATASEAIKDSYKGLKRLILQRFAANTDAAATLTKYEKQPEVWKAPLENELRQAGADQDETIVKAAQHLMILVYPQQAITGKFSVQITGNIQGYAQGDNQNVTMNFGNEPKER